MTRVVHSVLCAILIVGGATMVVSGWHGFAKDEPAALDAQDEGPRFCAPTLGEIAEDFGAGVAARKLGWLAVFCLGMLVVSGSILALVPKGQA